MLFRHLEESCHAHLLHQAWHMLGEQWFSMASMEAHENANVLYLTEPGYAPETPEYYLRSAAHFVHWNSKRGVLLSKIDEAPIDRFLDEHLPHCRCAARCRRTRADVRAALKQFFAMHGQVRLRQIPDILAAIANESDDFTLHLVEVRGPSVSTCAVLRRHVLEFFVDRFGTNSVRTSKLVPANVIRFVMHRMRALVPSAVKDIGISLRSYFRFKALPWNPNNKPHRGAATCRLVARRWTAGGSIVERDEATAPRFPTMNSQVIRAALDPK